MQGCSFSPFGNVQSARKEMLLQIQQSTCFRLPIDSLLFNDKYWLQLPLDGMDLLNFQPATNGLHFRQARSMEMKEESFLKDISQIDI